MLRENIIQNIKDHKQPWDIIVIGGGSTGIGAAIEAKSRGLRTLLIEQFDFSKGTSSRSTKLVHGGVRYLAQGNISLVKEALRERGRLKKNAPHLVKDQTFIIPIYTWWEVPFYTTGLIIYDFLSGKLSLGKSRPLSKEKTKKKLPTLITKNLYGGVKYLDGQFDDSRLAINMVQTLIEMGGVAINYMAVTNLLKDKEKVCGVVTIDSETGEEHIIKSKVVLNATGVFVDQVRNMDKAGVRDLVRVSQGIHLVLDKKFMPGDDAIMIPKTRDGRVLFAIPWHDKVVVGTTDVAKNRADIEPVAMEEEVDFILDTARQFLVKPPIRSDVKSIFAGLRPLAAPKREGKNTKEISRGHIIEISDSGLVTVTGGKWTTYRQMAEDVINRIDNKFSINAPGSNTDKYKIHGYKTDTDFSDPFYYYGSDKELMMDLVGANMELGEYLSRELNIIKAQVIWAVRFEMARTVEDFLSRRTRALLLDARESVKIAPEVATLMAKELNKNGTWITDQAEQYTALAKGYMLK